MATKIGAVVVVAAVMFVGGCVQAPRQSSKPPEPPAAPPTTTRVERVTQTPTEQEVAAADYGGPAPSAQEIKRQVSAIVKAQLKDPGSGKIEWGACRKGWLATRDTITDKSSVRYGYFVDVQVESLNNRATAGRE